MRLDNNSGMIFSALILSSGMSERMGQPKALLRWDDSRNFLEKIVNEYLDSGCEKVICTVNREVMPHVMDLEDIPHLRLVLNEHPEWGRMHSIKLGLAEIPVTDYCFIQNVDNPFIDSNIIIKIREAANPNTWCSPEFQGKGGHPVLIPKPVIHKILEDNNLENSLRDMLGEFPKKVVPMDNDLILIDINTTGDYRRFREKTFLSDQ